MGKPVVHNPHYPPPSMSHSTHQQPAATQSSVRGEISGNHQLYDPNNPNASHPNTQGQRGKTSNPPPPSQHYHGTKPLQFQEQPMYGGDSAAPQTNGRKLFDSFFFHQSIYLYVPCTRAVNWWHISTQKLPNVGSSIAISEPIIAGLVSGRGPPNPMK